MNVVGHVPETRYPPGGCVPFVVYTAVFGGRDILKSPRRVDPEVHYVCFTDETRLSSDHWDFVRIPPVGDPVMQSKGPKILSHLFLDCKMSLWIDASFELVDLRLDELRRAVSTVRDPRVDLFLTRHPQRTCLYDEIRHCLRRRKDVASRLRNAKTKYEAAGFPLNAGLYKGGVLLRRHTPEISEFNEAWYAEVRDVSRRDQVSLPVVLRELGIPVEKLPRKIPHLRGSNHPRRRRPVR